MAQNELRSPSEDEERKDIPEKPAFGFKYMGWAYIDAYINANYEKEELNTVTGFWKNKPRAPRFGIYRPDHLKPSHEEE